MRQHGFRVCARNFGPSLQKLLNVAAFVESIEQRLHRQAHVHKSYAASQGIRGLTSTKYRPARIVSTERQ